MAESVVQGNRIQMLEKKRQQEKEEMEFQRKKLADEASKVKVGTIGEKFSRHADVVESAVREATVGLLTLEQIRQKKEEIERLHCQERKEKKSKKSNKGKTALSFDQDEGTDVTEPVVKKQKITKNPAVDTSFLPDRERELQEAEERERLRKEWLDEQQKIKDTEIDVTYSYWDGAGHRRTTRVE
eukprot:c16268_g1_i2.p1 GENE.c16268_g1_i2~~c16268_g1_i2.p1  ORF type:complete len:216 (-),score=55.58 c16268_g1_i2:955-1509(-)